MKHVFFVAFVLLFGCDAQPASHPITQPQPITQPPAQAKPSDVYLTTRSVVNLRFVPSTDGVPLAELPRGVRLTPIFQRVVANYTWYRVSVDGSEWGGWVRSDVVTVHGDASAIPIANPDVPSAPPAVPPLPPTQITQPTHVVVQPTQIPPTPTPIPLGVVTTAGIVIIVTAAP
jgi:hypothetical protein